MIKVACLAILSLGLLLLCGGEAPRWLLIAELFTAMVAALAFGFSEYSPTIPLLRHREVRGMACVYIGCAAMFVDPRFVISAFFIGAGTRLVMTGVGKVTAGVGDAGSDLAVRESSRSIVR